MGAIIGFLNINCTNFEVATSCFSCNYHNLKSSKLTLFYGGHKITYLSKFSLYHTLIRKSKFRCLYTELLLLTTRSHHSSRLIRRTTGKSLGISNKMMPLPPDTKCFSLLLRHFLCSYSSTNLPLPFFGFQRVKSWWNSKCGYDLCLYHCTRFRTLSVFTGNAPRMSEQLACYFVPPASMLKNAK